MNIQSLIDSKLREKNDARKDRVSSGKWKPSLFGACYRRQWWSKHSEPETDPTDERGLRVFAAGQLFHDFVQEFFTNSEKEVLIETEEVKGYADLVTADEVIDLKSVHSDSFWYMLKCVLVTIEVKGVRKEVRVEEGNIDGDKVRYGNGTYQIIEKKTISILDEKINNWLQVGWYAVQLGKEKCRLVFISKDDLCIKEYVICANLLKPIVEAELKALNELKECPEGSPRLYGGKECEYCNWKTKCKGETNV